MFFTFFEVSWLSLGLCCRGRASWGSLIAGCRLSYRLRILRASEVVLVVKNLPAKGGDKRRGFDPWVGRSPGGGHGNPLQYLHLENPHGQRSLVGSQSIGLKRFGHD